MKKSKSIIAIKNMYLHKNIDSEKVYHKTELLLSIYRNVVWQTLDQLEYFDEDINSINSDFLSNGLDAAFTYLENFSTDWEKEKFMGKAISISETKWFIELIDKAMYKVYNYYDNGRLYHEILSKTYLVNAKYPQEELLEILDIERSTYYRKKKEAILLLGISLWGYAIPEMKEIFDEYKTYETIPEYYR